MDISCASDRPVDELNGPGFLLSSWDEDLIRRSVSREPARVIGMIGLLQGLGHVPFDRAAPEASTQRVPRRFLSARPHPDIAAHLTEVKSTSNPDLLRVRGWAHHPEHAVEEVIFIDRRRRRRSRILLGLHRAERRRHIGRRAAAVAGWEGFVEWRRWPGGWTPYVGLASDPVFYPIPRSVAAQKHLQEIFVQRIRPRP